MSMDATGARDLRAVCSSSRRGSGWSRSTSTTASLSWPRRPRKTSSAPGCGAVAWAHGRRPVWVRDLPVGGPPDDADFVQAVVTLPLRARRDPYVVRDQPRDCVAGLTDDLGGAAGLAPDRPRRRAGRRRGLGPRSGVGDRDARGARLRRPVGRRPGWPGWPRLRSTRPPISPPPRPIPPSPRPA